jgi:hypothetical protein
MGWETGGMALGWECDGKGGCSTGVPQKVLVKSDSSIPNWKGSGKKKNGRTGQNVGRKARRKVRRKARRKVKKAWKEGRTDGRKEKSAGRKAGRQTGRKKGRKKERKQGQARRKESRRRCYDSPWQVRSPSPQCAQTHPGD